MTQEEFKKELDKRGYPYEIEGNKIVITKECGALYLDSLIDLPSNVVFMNNGGIYLTNLKTLPEGIVFSNRGGVDLRLLEKIPQGIVFSNGGNVYLKSLMEGFFGNWKGNIEGINYTLLLNKMIALGLFDR
jgi:hypothetical protein